MARVVCASAAVWVLMLFCPAAASAQWYRTYEEGRDALSRGDYAAAEQKLTASVGEAASAGVKPGRSVRTYGMRFINFVPDYYLAVLFAERAQQAEGNPHLADLRAAEAAFSRVRASKLGIERDREFADLDRQFAAVQTALAAATTTARNDAPPPVTAMSVPESSAPIKPAAPDVEGPVGLTPVLPSSRAPQVSGMAGAVPPDASRSEPPLVTEPPKALPPPATPSNRGTTGTARNTRVPSAGSPDAPSRAFLPQGIRAFFKGDYVDAARLLRVVTAGSDAPPSAHFYLACSYAAMALLREDAALAAEARVAWREAGRSGNGFVQERRFISPRILQLISAESSPTVR